jgi:mRNA interferase RelE/StbE
VYTIVFVKEAHQALLKMPRNTALLIRQKLEQVSQDPYATNLNANKLQNRPGYRLRVSDWRVLYEIQNDEMIVLVLKIAPRGEVYR